MSFNLKYWGPFTGLLLSLNTLIAQNGLRIEGRIANAKPVRLVLAQHFAGELMPIDTAFLGTDGRIVWKTTEPIPAGMCRILGIGKGLDIVVADSQQFSFEADMNDLIAGIRFQHSAENALFFNYQREVRKRYQRALAYRQQMGIKEDTDPRWKARFQDLNEGVKKYVDSLFQKHPQSFVVHFLKSYQEPKLPVLPLQHLAAKDSAYLQSYVLEHFFDNSFLADERMLYTSTFPARFERFLKSIVLLPKEELIKVTDKVIEQSKNTTELRKYMLSKLASQFELTSLPKLDEVYQFIVQKYVIGEPGLWDASTLQKTKEMQLIKGEVAIGKTFPNLTLTDVAGNNVGLESVKSDHTVLFFYDPGCIHCRETTPKLTALAKQYADKLQVFAVSLDADEKLWKNFIADFKTQNFINVRDITRKIEFQKLGVFNYPTIYLLDRDKKMVARWLSVEQLSTYLLNR